MHMPIYGQTPSQGFPGIALFERVLCNSLLGIGNALALTKSTVEVPSHGVPRVPLSTSKGLSSLFMVTTRPCTVHV